MFGFAKKLVNTIETQATNYLNVATTQQDSPNNLGLRVVAVDKNSIGSKYGFESWFDFIIAVNGRPISEFIGAEPSSDPNPYQTSPQQPESHSDYSLLLSFLSTEVNTYRSSLTLRTWSAKGGVTRDVVIPNEEFTPVTNDQLDDIPFTPETSTPTSNVQNSAFKRLQLTLQLSSTDAAFHVWHVLRVQPNSPAYVAGIMPDEYILNCEGGLLATGGEDLLGRVVQSVYTKWRVSVAQQVAQQQVVGANITPCSVVLYVYNHDYDVVRPVTVYPNDQWGGRGLLGCDIGYGLLHRVPEVLGKFRKVEGGEVEEEDDEVDLTPGGVLYAAPASDNVLAPAVRAPSFGGDESVAGAVAPPPRRSKKTSKYVQKEDLREYFEEEAAKSREVDGGRQREGSGEGEGVPPPPKVTKEVTSEANDERSNL